MASCKQMYTGIDSAWGGRSPGGLCTLEGGTASHVTLRKPPTRKRWDGLIEEVRGWDASPRVVAVDQPIVVPNADSMRPVERPIAMHYAKVFGCSAYPANTSNVNCFGRDAGLWRLVAALEAGGFRYDPAGSATGESGCTFFECYPHLSLLGLFDLDRVLRYKVHKREPDEWSRVLQCLVELQDCADLPLLDACGFLELDMAQTKTNEDLVDALICAYTAAWVHRFGLERSFILGDAETGAIVSPASAAMCVALPPDAFVDVVDAGPIDVPIPTSEAPDRRPAAASAIRVRPSGEVARGGSVGGLERSVLGKWHHATLWATDTGCLWRNANRRPLNVWLDRFASIRAQRQLHLCSNDNFTCASRQDLGGAVQRRPAG